MSALVQIIATRGFGHPVSPTYTVRIDGEEYEVNKYLLASLQSGDETVQSLELEPVSDEPDDDYPELPRGYRSRMMRRSGAFGRD